MAQKTIDGKVFSADDQQPVAGATVTVKSTGAKTTTDQSGVFRISTAENDVLVVTIGGFITKEVGINEAGSIFLKPDSKNLNEVVVTALGVKKEKRIIGYSSQDVKGSDLVKARESNPINSLVGKVSGLTVGASAELLGNPQVLLRGGNINLYVVDGVPINSDTWNINPDDIESYTVLKGPVASALYGYRGTKWRYYY